MEAPTDIQDENERERSHNLSILLLKTGLSVLMRSLNRMPRFENMTSSAALPDWAHCTSGLHIRTRLNGRPFLRI